MSIDYRGHCALPLEEARARIAFARQAKPEWFCDPLWLYDAKPLGLFDHEIALGFGIDARCTFLLSVFDKERMACLEEAIDFLYEVFGTEGLVITWGLDKPRPPRASCPPMAINTTEGPAMADSPPARRRSPGLRFLLGLAAFIGTVVAVYVAVLLGYDAWAEATGFFDREGATAMGVAFTIAPMVSLLAGGIAAVLVFRRR